MEYKQESRYGVSEYDLGINQYDVLIDGDEIIYFRDCNDDAFGPVGERIFFKTKEEAERYAKKQKEELEVSCKNIKRALERFERLSGDILDRKDYLTEDIIDSINQEKSNFYYGVLARKYISFGIINIGGKSFTKDKVSHIEWDMGLVRIVLDDGLRILAAKPFELMLIRDIFGDNY